MTTPPQEIYLAGGCLWGVEEYLRHIPGVLFTEAGRINGTTNSLESPYDGYAECVRTRFNPDLITVESLIDHLLKIIDPYSVNKQGRDIGKKYRTGIYSQSPHHLKSARTHLQKRPDRDKLALEILPVSNYLRSAEEHQDRLQRFPDDYCHIPRALLKKQT
ncbi:MAG: peptide-methionine (S)-S-oxide reductase [Spirochaetales bacterium]|nr:peptide-methionine (S)-S-oxide reductase [Spirochaetales bacterium]